MNGLESFVQLQADQASQGSERSPILLGVQHHFFAGSVVSALLRLLELLPVLLLPL